MESWKRAFLLLLITILTSSRGQVNVTVLDPGSETTPITPVPTTTVNPSEPPLKDKDDFLDWLVSDTRDEHHVEYEGYDGWYNNPTHPELGSVDSQLVRLLPPAYADGVYAPSGADRPNPLDLSMMLMNGTSGKMSNTGKTALLVFFGQQVVEELLDVQRPGCPPEYFNIKIPENHEYYKANGPKEMPVLRSRYDVRTGQSPNNPRQQINEITPWIDGGLMYGVSKGWSDGLRSFKDGLLASTPDGKYPAYNDIKLPMANPPPPRQHKLEPVERFHRLGNPRGNENPFLLTFGVFWFRWHNKVAKALKRKHPKWTDERLFNEARKWVIATHQHMVINEWLPEWLGEDLPPYKDYDPSIDPGIAHEFQTTAMRFGHTLVTSGGYRRSGQKGGCKVFETTGKTKISGHRAVRTCNSFWNPKEAVEEHDIDALLLGLASQPSEKEDNVIVEDLRGRVFGPLEFSRRDLMAINIQRARDHGLPDYKTARRVLKLRTFDNFVEMAKICSNVHNLHPEIFDTILPKIYGNNTDLIDIWVGGILETEATRPGELFRTIIKDQMRRIRNGDRFWFENEGNGLFTNKQVEKIKKINMYKLIWAITEIEHGDLQYNPFRLPADTNPGLEDTCRASLNMSNYSCFNVTSKQNDTCFYLPPLAPPLVSECKLPENFDYFSGSEVSYALTFTGMGLFVIGCFVVVFLLTKKRQLVLNNLRGRNTKRTMKKLGNNTKSAVEWIGKKEGTRQVVLKFNENKIITIHRLNGEKVRFIDLTRVGTIELQVAVTAGYQSHYYITIRVAREYDLVLKFDNANERDNFIRSLEEYLGSIGVGRQRREVTVPGIINGANTKANRQKELEKFFRVVFAQAFGIEHNTQELLQVDSSQARNVINTEITLFEFSEALSLRPDSVFVEKMFSLADKGNKGYISFREFLDIIVIFAQGSPEDKMKLMFDMYDIDRSGKLTSEEFSDMISSMIELANESLPSDQLNILLSTMFKKAGLNSKQDLTLNDFKRLMADYKSELGYAQLCIGGIKAPMQTEVRARQSAIIKAHVDLHRAYSYTNDFEMEGDNGWGSVKIESGLTPKPITKDSWFLRVKRYCDNYKLHIFWLVLYTTLLFGIFVERMYYYSLEREHGGLRKIAGYGISVTRGAASVMMFTYSSILLTMCRNLITFFRETFLKNYIPFDYFITFHKYIAFWGLIFTIIHTIGHAFNFYHIATQTADDLTCLFRDYYHATDELPKFHYWCYGTITGLTGVLLVLVLAVIYIFALSFARRNVFKAFWFTHNLYPIFYILMTLHGLGRVVQRPFFYYFFLGPLCVFVLDQMISISRKKIEISVVRTIIHPSDVLELQLKRPPNFQYRSGQWARIACPLLNSDEYHPFTISSAPNEENISLHIRAVGPWTTNIRQLLDPNNIQYHAYPKIYLDGPFGEGHQDWYQYEVSVLVGGGIGVTPFASILKDVVHKASSNTAITCKKVYFLWITRTQKHFEWMTDIIRYVENNDSQKLVECHIFITQFYHKFDLRTTMLYICERHFQKISNRSLFTGLQSITHFDRPDMKEFLNSLKQAYSHKISKVGVFSCGPPPMTLSVQEACDQLNKKEGINFIHHFENF